MNPLPKTTYTGLLVYTDNHVYISAISDELDEQHVDHAVVLRWMNGKWAHKSLDMSIRGMAVKEGDSLSLLNMGTNGRIVEFLFPGERIGLVDPSEDGPSNLLHLRCMKKIGSHYYVAGMARRVYRSAEGHVWSSIDAGVFLPKEERSRAAGFNAIAGFDENDIYAVGYGGEIWHYNGRKWHEIKSPTDVVLNCLCCDSFGNILIGGMAGILLKAACGGSFEPISHGVTKEDIWSIAEFGGRIYFSTIKGVFVQDGDVFSKIDMKRDVPISTAYLDASKSALWSVGEEDIVFTKDGISWEPVQRP